MVASGGAHGRKVFVILGTLVLANLSLTIAGIYFDWVWLDSQITATVRHVLGAAIVVLVIALIVDDYRAPRKSSTE